MKKSWLFWDVTQRLLVVVYRHFGTAYQSHLQQHSSPETSVRDYQRTLRNIAEDLRHQLNCSVSLESRGKIYALLSRNTNKMQLVIEFIIPEFIEGSSYFERHTAHHQEF